MFCDQCKLFWSKAVKRAEVDFPVTSWQNIRWARHEKLLYTYLWELEHSSDLGCQLCRIIHRTPPQYRYEDHQPNQYNPLDIIVDVESKSGRPPELTVTFRDTVLGRVRVKKRVLAIGALWTEDADFISILRRSSENDDSTGSDGSLMLASYWLNQCDSRHSLCLFPDKKKHLTYRPKRLLDVSDSRVRLVETDDSVPRSAGRYIALSHCWGKFPDTKTTRENYEAHLRNVDRLGKTFRDAVHATRGLGFRYLWIDALCIIQDDDEDWAAEAATMCDVYQYAALTIAAAHAPDGDTGCFQERDGLTRMPLIVELPYRRARNSNRDATYKSVFVLFEPLLHAHEDDVFKRPLYERAWVLQEQLLSPRMLIFDGPQLRWDCLTERAAGGIPPRGISHVARLQRTIRAGILNNDEFFASPEKIDPTIGAQSKAIKWSEIVVDYTHRRMTRSKDRLIALAGTAEALSRHTRFEYLAGLWSGFFWLGMLWSIPHFDLHSFSGITTDTSNNYERVRHSQALAPTWSWASVTVPVRYPFETLDSTDAVPICEILNTTTKGSAAAQTGRVIIRGHIRKGCVNAVYPYVIREASANGLSHMMTQEPNKSAYINYGGRSFNAEFYFLFSNPFRRANQTGRAGFHRRGSDAGREWRLMKGTFCPDQIVHPDTEITFLAIAQKHESDIFSRKDTLKVYSLALIPTSDANGEYTRVGYAEWRECAWYGYACGRPDALGPPGKRGRDGLWVYKKGVMDRLKYRLNWRPVEVHQQERPLNHPHQVEANKLPDLRIYSKDVGVEEKVIGIV